MGVFMLYIFCLSVREHFLKMFFFFLYNPIPLSEILHEPVGI